ncbi:Bestrophin, RFP-TM, chloride channel-domain-containing protein [Crucibulum laeve]|uniref:Bestrophin, RFP-TM, chloride channel-domain-containing protein n=1 Tax=Crucibulum laeve TaxID=68775 RepID=A0A5C3MA30_9AGAR|nr:Bestrophin, RFP-TM, chloride channel-domain-containing protein [Crucibulum laeve]
MVTRNPLFHAHWTVQRFRATIVTEVWPAVLFFTLIALMVYLVSSQTSHSLAIPSDLLTVLGIVLGLVVSFRTSSAYEKYEDGRKMWTTIMSTSRNLAQMIWIHVPDIRKDQGAQKWQTELHSIIEKKSMINLIQAFPVSVKHFLRGEEGVYYKDLYPLVAFLPRYATTHPARQTPADRLPLWNLYDTYEELVHNSMQNRKSSVEKQSDVQYTAPSSFDPEMALPQVDSDYPLKPARNPPPTSIDDYVPLLRFFKWLARVFPPHSSVKKTTSKKRKAYSDIVESKVPLEIILTLSKCVSRLMRCDLLTQPIAVGINSSLTTLQDTLSDLERICNTPLPFAYQAHLRISVWTYLFFLPFQIEASFKYLTIPATAFAAFLLLGFLEIGHEIENPFNYDLNDLDLDYFCLAIQRELHQITAQTHLEPSDFVFSSWNQPFVPADRRGADDIVSQGEPYRGPDDSGEPGKDSIKRTLVRGWKDVNTLTHR